MEVTTVSTTKKIPHYVFQKLSQGPVKRWDSRVYLINLLNYLINYFIEGPSQSAPGHERNFNVWSGPSCQVCRCGPSSLYHPLPLPSHSSEIAGLPTASDDASRPPFKLDHQAWWDNTEFLQNIILNILSYRPGGTNPVHQSCRRGVGQHRVRDREDPTSEQQQQQSPHSKEKKRLQSASELLCDKKTSLCVSCKESQAGRGWHCWLVTEQR